MAGEATEPTITRNAAAQQFETQVDGYTALLQYQRRGDHIILVHTEVPQELAGKGLGGKLARAALEDAKAQNLTVSPQCPFVAEYITRHQEYLPLVAPSYRERLTSKP